jgi:hypothetical protein
MNQILKRTLKYSILYPAFLTKRLYIRYLRKNNPIKLMKMTYKNNMGIPLNLDNPQTLDEKINYMSFYTDTSLWSELADKVRVREYVIKNGFPEILNELYGVYESPDEINFESLPDRFVLKTNHASATNIFVRNKNDLNIKSAKKKLKKWLKIDYGYITATPHYSKIKPLILAEKYLLENGDYDKSLIDYKFYCFHGKPMYIFVFSERTENTHKYKRMIYDVNWEPHPEYINKGLATPNILHILPRPYSFDKMLMIAERLSKPFPFVRIDFYEINKEPVFGEMTFTPGHNETADSDFIKTMGDLIDLSNIKVKNV